MSSYRAFDPSFPTQKEKARAAGRAFEVQGVLDDWLHILRPRRRMQELFSYGVCGNLAGLLSFAGN